MHTAQSAMHCLIVVQIPVAATNTTAQTRQPPPLKSPSIQKHYRLVRPATHKRLELNINQDNAMAKNEIKCTETRRFSLLAATQTHLLLHRLTRSQPCRQPKAPLPSPRATIAARMCFQTCRKQKQHETPTLGRLTEEGVRQRCQLRKRWS
jgi:hypothetical protein